MQMTLTNLAAHIIGVNTPCFLYLNEVMAHTIVAGRADTTSRDLACIPGHQNLVTECLFPAGETSTTTLYRFAQSTAYHQRLKSHPKILGSVMGVLKDIPNTGTLVIGAEPISQSVSAPPHLIDIKRGFTQLEYAASCYCEFARLPASGDTLAEYLEWFYYPLHSMIAALMILGGIKTKLTQGERLQEEIISWLQHVYGLLKTIQNICDHTKSKSWTLEEGAIAMAASGEKTFGVLVGNEFFELTRVIRGIDLGLLVFIQSVQSPGVWSGQGARGMVQFAHAVQEQSSAPLVARFKDIQRAAKQPKGEA